MGIFKKTESTIGIGIEIDGSIVRVARTQLSGKKVQIKELHELILEPGQDAFGEEATQIFFQNLSLNKKAIASNLENPALRIRRMELPPMPEADFIEAIRFNLRDQIESDPNEYEIRYSILGVTEGAVPKKEIVVFGIPGNVIAENVSLYKDNNMKLEVLEPSAVAIASWFDRMFPNDTGINAIVHFSYRHSFFVVVENGTFLFSRPLLDLPCSIIAGEDTAEAALKASLSIQKSIDSFCLIFRKEKVDKIILSGFAPDTNTLMNSIKQNLGLEIIEMGQNYDSLLKNETQVQNEDILKYTVALALSTSST